MFWSNNTPSTVYCKYRKIALTNHTYNLYKTSEHPFENMTILMYQYLKLNLLHMQQTVHFLN